MGFCFAIPCGKKVNHEREDSIQHYVAADLQTVHGKKHSGAPYVLATGSEAYNKWRKQH